MVSIVRVFRSFSPRMAVEAGTTFNSAKESLSKDSRGKMNSETARAAFVAALEEGDIFFSEQLRHVAALRLCSAAPVSSYMMHPIDVRKFGFAPAGADDGLAGSPCYAFAEGNEIFLPAERGALGGASARNVSRKA